ncbi:T9SS type A sorting domain-containing protein [Oscillatoria amoena NRMC-F 0135]|nr:T9SS type A sorting domain-containing protein [Oscillatoria amoena NRMC-F 0135]
MRIVSFTILAVISLLSLPAHAQYSRETSADVSKGISVYPNPAADDYVFVKMEDLDARQVKFTLYNIIGNEIRTEIEVLDQHEVRMRIKDLAAGYYLIALREDGTKFRGTYKFLKR